jgi:hypothetical protein
MMMMMMMMAIVLKDNDYIANRQAESDFLVPSVISSQEASSLVVMEDKISLLKSSLAAIDDDQPASSPITAAFSIEHTFTKRTSRRICQQTM